MPDGDRPNVLFVMADDHAASAVGSYGARLAPVAPTFLEYADCPVPDEMAGRSLCGPLSGDTPDDWRESVYYLPDAWRSPRRAGPLRHPDRAGQAHLLLRASTRYEWGAQEPTEPGWELYDLRRDPDELRKVYDDPAYADA